MKSIMQDSNTCYLCGRNGNGDALETHHVFFGNPGRKHSEADGLKVRLCGCRCHREGKNAVHQNAETDALLKRQGQAAWEHAYGTREAFLRRYGKNYL